MYRPIFKYIIHVSTFKKKKEKKKKTVGYLKGARVRA